ncbi:diguanylate cyclase [Sulfuricurvum sp.]|uniref:diguanylate cyclase n=1 Tax=Sulfuricurvum sp. TaxID=2025608 RepID=UPI0025FD48B7|nr:diguanylate cyclase [Sulfuricurvum sp.]
MVTIPYPNVLLDALEIGVMVIDESFEIRYWNQWLEINTAHPASEMIGKNLHDFYPQIDYKVFARKIRTTLRLASPTFYDASLQNRFIEIPRTKITTSLLINMQLQVTISPYIVEEGLVMVSIYDISDLHELKLTLQSQMEKISELNCELHRDKMIIDANLLITKIDEECRIVEATQAFLEFFGYKKESVIGEYLSQVFGDVSVDFDTIQICDAIARQQKWSGEVKAVLANGEEVWFDTVVTPLNDDENGTLSYTVIFHDISDKKRIELLSITDPLTKLFNRHKFNEVFENMIRRRHWDENHTFGLIIADVDHFKRVNDTYGHQSGDKVLIEVAHVFSQTIRTGDILARWGGEEFVCLLPDVDMEKALYVAEKLRLAVEELHFADAGTITSSFGVSIFTPGDTQESMIHRADSSLYRAKENGRNRVECI